jgi:hypothetical protein
MIITIRGDSIDITEIPLSQHIEWESLLNELKGEHIPGWYQDGKRMGVSVVEGKAHVFIYRTASMPPEAKILENPQAARDFLTGQAALGR